MSAEIAASREKSHSGCCGTADARNARTRERGARAQSRGEDPSTSSGRANRSCHVRDEHGQNDAAQREQRCGTDGSTRVSAKRCQVDENGQRDDEVASCTFSSSTP